jgi:hypothetical protein
MLTVRDQQMQEMAQASPGTPVVVPCDPTWIEVHLVDTEKKPIAGEPYRIKMPDMSIREGTLDEEGKVRFDGIPAGQCQVCFPRIHGKEWKRI